MTWTQHLAAWWIDYLAAATILLVVALIAGYLIRQPVQRMALAWSTLIALVVLAVCCAIPSWPRIALIPREVAATSPATIPTAPVPVNIREPSTAPSPSAPTLPPLSPYVRRQPSTAPTLPFPPANRTQTTNPPPALPASPLSTNQLDPSSLVAAALLTGAFTITCWLVIGQLRTIRLCRRAQPAPEFAHQELRALAGSNTHLPRLLVDQLLSTAAALGLRHPTILLPASAVEAPRSPLAPREDHFSRSEKTTLPLRALLAHEYAHIQHRDLWLLALGRVLLIVLFAHPLYHLLRRRTRTDQELLADAAAAQHCGRHEYAETLVAWARHQPHPSSRMNWALGIWERPSQLSRRISMLLNERTRLRMVCSRRWRTVSLCFAITFVVGLSIFTLNPTATVNAETMPTNQATWKDVPIVGNGFYSPEELKSAIDIDADTILNSDKIEKARGRIGKFYREHGFKSTRVFVTEKSVSGKKIVVFQVAEGTVPVSAVRFNFHSTADNERLHEVVNSEGGREVDRQELDEAIRALTSLGRSLGYFDIKVDFELRFDQKNNTAAIDLIAEVGPRYFLRSVSFAGNEKFADKQITKGLKMKPGDPFDQDTLNSDEGTIRDLYGGHGYVFADVQADLKLGLEEDDNQVDLVYNIKEGTQYRIGKLYNVSGETKLAAPLAQRRVGLNPGDMIDIRKVRSVVGERQIAFSKTAVEDVADIMISDASKQSKTETHSSPPKSWDIPTATTPYFQKEQEDRLVLDGHKRVPILGPVTSGGPAKTLDLPSDEEVLRALEKSHSQKGGSPFLPEESHRKVRIVKEKIADYVDEVHTYPLLDKAQLHHAHYKCTVYIPKGTYVGDKTNNEDTLEVVHVDHNHFHKVADSTANSHADTDKSNLTITGVCLDENKEPVRDASVRLFHIDYKERTQREVEIIKTDKNGRFQFSPIEHNEALRKRYEIFSQLALYVVAQAPGKATILWNIDAGVVGVSKEVRKKMNAGFLYRSSFGPPADEPLKFTFTPAATLRGRVTDEGGKPLGGATVSASYRLLKFVPGLRNTVTDSEGRFEIADLPAFDGAVGNSSLLSTSPGSSTNQEYGGVHLEGYAHNLFKFSKVPNELHITMQRPAKLDGQAVFEASGQPAADVYIQLQGQNSYSDSVRTDKAGSFSLDRLPPGKYYVRADLAGWPTIEHREFEVRAGKNTLDLKIAGGCTIKGRVVDSATGKLVRSSYPDNFLLIQSCSNRGENSNHAGVDENGEFTLHAPAGENLLMIYDGTSQDHCWIVEKGRTTGYKSVTAAKGETVEVELKSKRWSLESGEPPPTYFLPFGPGQKMASEMASELFGGLVDAIVPEFLAEKKSTPPPAPTPSQPPQSKSPTPNGASKNKTDTNANAQSPKAFPPVTITGTCLDENHKPVANAHVRLYRHDNTPGTASRPMMRVKMSAAVGPPGTDNKDQIIFSPRTGSPASQRLLHETKTDEQGRFQFPEMAADERWETQQDTYWVIAQASGKGTAFQCAHIFKENIDKKTVKKTIRPLDVTLQPASSLRGRITDDRGQPVAGAIVSCGEAQMNLPKLVPGIQCAVTDADGRYEINDLAPFDIGDMLQYPTGFATVQYLSAAAAVEHPDYAQGVLEYTKLPAQADGVLHRPASVHGQVVLDESGKPAPQARLMVMTENNPLTAPLAVIETDAEGKFAVAKLSPGKYTIEAKLPERLATSHNIELKAGDQSLDFRLKQGGVIKGRLIDDATGKAPDLTRSGYAVSVAATNGVVDPNCHSWVDKDGSFLIAVHPGKNMVTFPHPEWETIDADRWLKPGVEVAQGETVEIELRVKQRNGDWRGDWPAVLAETQRAAAIAQGEPAPPAPAPRPERHTDHQWNRWFDTLESWTEEALPKNPLTDEKFMQMIAKGGDFPAHRETIDGQEQITGMSIHCDTNLGQLGQAIWLEKGFLARIEKFPQLKIMLLIGGPIADDWLQPLRGHQRLESLDIIFAKNLTAAGVAHLATLPNLKSFSIVGYHIDDKALHEVGQFPKLEKFTVGGVFTDAGIAHFAEQLQEHAQIKTLLIGGLRDSKITDESLHHLAALNSLEELSLYNSVEIGVISPSQFTDAGLKHLAVLTKLHTLQIGGEKVTDAGLVHLRALKNLKSVSLESTSVTPAGIADLKQHLPEVKVTLTKHGEEIADTAMKPANRR